MSQKAKKLTFLAAETEEDTEQGIAPGQKRIKRVPLGSPDAQVAFVQRPLRRSTAGAAIGEGPSSDAKSQLNVTPSPISVIKTNQVHKRPDARPGSAASASTGAVAGPVDLLKRAFISVDSEEYRRQTAQREKETVLGREGQRSTFNRPAPVGFSPSVSPSVSSPALTPYKQKTSLSLPPILKEPPASTPSSTSSGAAAAVKKPHAARYKEITDLPEVELDDNKPEWMQEEEASQAGSTLSDSIQ